LSLHWFGRRLVNRRVGVSRLINHIGGDQIGQSSYLIGEIVVIPLTDYLSRVFSFRNIMLSFASLFAAFSVACAFAIDLPSMIALRAVQGFFGGVLIPMAFTLVFTKLPKGQQPIGLAMFSLAVTFAATSPRTTADKPFSSSTSFRQP
jgi:MFS family permease